MSTQATLTQVYLHPQAYYAATQHALSIETEEIMGVLLGSWDDDDSPTVVHITSILPLQRMHKVRAKDRVEVAPADMVQAQQEAEQLNQSIVGWYHSHPHIVVLPSHVDSRTQGSLQRLGSGFVGLIFEAFSHDQRTGTGSLNAVAFQSDHNANTNQYEYRTIPLNLSEDEGGVDQLSVDTSIATAPDKASAQVRGLLALVTQLEIAFKEEKEAFDESVGEEKCANHLRKISCCGNYQQVLTELAEASLVLQQQEEDRSIFVKEETLRVQHKINRLRSELNSEQFGTFQ